MIPRPSVTLAAAAATLLAASRAVACPSCPTSERVQAIVLGEGFLANVGISLLPFGIIAAATIVAHRMGRVDG